MTKPGLRKVNGHWLHAVTRTALQHIRVAELHGLHTSKQVKDQAGPDEGLVAATSSTSTTYCTWAGESCTEQSEHHVPGSMVTQILTAQ